MARDRGNALIVAVLVLFLLAATLFATELASGRAAARRDRVTEGALAQAREALVAYAADRPLNAVVGPGYLPCPDLDNDGWAEATCGSLDGQSGQAQRLGRLPWKTLGLADLRDGSGERLWYAVSSKYKGLLNCAQSRACLDMTPPVALGTITVRDASGLAVHDGTLADPARAQAGGAAAVVIAPGPALRRIADGSGTPGLEQRRDCAAADCDADGACVATPPQRAAACDPANYLDRAPASASGEDNADFIDRNDAAGRGANGNGFIQGPVVLGDGRIAVNDRLLAITYRDVMPSIMRRVALEVVHCLRYYAARPENGGRYPWPAPSCRDGATFGNASDESGRLLGSIPDTPFTRSATASAGAMLERWWRTAARVPENLAELPAADTACRIAIAPADAGPTREAPPGTPADEARSAGFAGNAWWSAWQPFVSYALAAGFTPAALAQCSGASCLDVVDSSALPVAEGRQLAVVVASSCSAAPQCDTALGCARIVLGAPARSSAHALATYP